MSEEFLRVAKKEVSDDILSIGTLLKGCFSDEDVRKNASDIEKYTHKLKGLCPMMGRRMWGILPLCWTLFSNSCSAARASPEFTKRLSNPTNSCRTKYLAMMSILRPYNRTSSKTMQSSSNIGNHSVKFV